MLPRTLKTDTIPPPPDDASGDLSTAQLSTLHSANEVGSPQWVQEVAQLMRVSSMTVYRLIRAGDLPAVRVGRSFRVRDVDVDGYLQSRYTQAG